MSYGSAASAYRDMEVLSAPPGRLVVMVYDFLLVNLRRSAIAIDTKNLELRSASLGKAHEALGELMGNLDLDRGGDIAAHLASLYVFFMGALIDVGRYNDKRLLGQITSQVSELRNAFAQITTTSTTSTTSTASAA